MEKPENYSVRGNELITGRSFVSEIVRRDYRTAAVFRRYGIAYCCGAKFPLEMVCASKNIDTDVLLDELKRSSRNIQVSSSINFANWEPSFLADYIVNIHHAYLKSILPVAIETLQQFSEGHIKKFSYLTDLLAEFSGLAKELLAHLRYEEGIIFPYIKQIAHAYRSRESYARLLVRTLSKPVEEVMRHDHKLVEEGLARIRELTNNYSLPAEACTSHRVSFMTLQEIDEDIRQHLYLENEILFPEAIRMEKELLADIDH
jgi:regulator of cell morphogenesis and NO signaling